MPNKKSSIFSVVAYFVFISLPLLAHVFMPTDDTQENRNLAAAPQWPDTWAAVGPNKTQLEAYLADHFGLRNLFIKLNNKFKYHVFNEVTSPQITLGNEGYIYLNSHDKNSPNALIKEVCGVLKPDQAMKNKLIDGIKGFIDFYQQQNIQVLFAVIPTKSKLYPEHLPAYLKTQCLATKTSWIEDLIGQIDPNSVLYPLSSFKAWKEHFAVFLPTHFHWHGETPSKTADLIFDKWDITALPEPTFKPHIAASDLSGHLSGLSFADNSIQYNHQNLTTCHSNQCIHGFTTHYANGVVKVITTENNTGRKLLVLSDSFGPHITAHLSRGFDQVYAVDLNQLQPREEVDFFQWIGKQTQPTHLIYLIHDGGVVWQSLRLQRVIQSMQQKASK